MSIEIIIDAGNIPQQQREEILSSFEKRISPIASDRIRATIVVNPDLGKYGEVTYMNSSLARFIKDEDGYVDNEVYVRLANFSAPSEVKTLLYIFETDMQASTVNVRSASFKDDGYAPQRILNELDFIKDDILFNERQSKGAYLLCVSGHRGIGKTHFAHRLAALVEKQLFLLNYIDLEGENTEVIARNASRYFSAIPKGSLILVDDADAFLRKSSANDYVKNIFLSYLKKRNDLVFVVETVNPQELLPEITKCVDYYANISPLERIEKLHYLCSFAEKSGIRISIEDVATLPVSNFQTAELYQVIRYTRIYISKGQSKSDALQAACNAVIKSCLNASVSSDSNLKPIVPKYSIDNLILPDEKKRTIEYAISLIDNIPVVYDDWNFKSIDPHPRAILNFYGKPGTGKTMCAHAVAKKLGKDLLALNYAEIESKYIGDAPKNLESAFAFAKQHDLVMFFDEADSFLGKRIENVTHSADQALNSLRSTMLIQLEMFNGVVLFASNLRSNYDKAFLSRFLYEIEFELPDKDCRRGMFISFFTNLNIINPARYSAEDWEQILESTDGFAGRDIKNAVLDALNRHAFNLKQISVTTENYLPIATLLDAIVQKKGQKEEQKEEADTPSSARAVKGDKETKKQIGNALKEKYSDEAVCEQSNQHDYKLLLQLASHAAWSDGSLHESEKTLLEKTASELNITLPNISDSSNLIPIDKLCNSIINSNIVNQAMEICCRIVASDQQYSDGEKLFIRDIATRFGLPEPSVVGIDKLIECMTIENQLIEEHLK